MRSQTRNRVRTRRGVEERRFRSALASRIGRLVKRGKAPRAPDAKHAARFTTLDAQNAHEAEATRKGLEVDAGRMIGGLREKLERLLATRRTLGRALEQARAIHSRMQTYLDKFEGRFPRSPELMVSAAKWTGVAIAAFIGALLIPDFELNTPAFEFLVPATGGSGFLAEHLDLLAALTFTAAQGVAAKLAGKHLSWAMSSLVVGVASPATDGSGAKPNVVSEWTRRQHAALGGVLAAFVAVSVVAIVSQRVGALELTGALASGSDGGLLGGAAPEPPKPNATMLALVSILPLVAAAILSGWIDGPMRSTLKKLRNDVAKQDKRVNALSAEIDKLDAEAGIVMDTADRVQAEKAIDQHLATLEVLYRHEIQVEAQPGFFGVYGERPPAGYPTSDQAFAAAAEADEGITESAADAIRARFGDLTTPSPEKSGADSDAATERRLTPLDIEEAPSNGQPAPEPDHDREVGS